MTTVAIKNTATLSKAQARKLLGIDSQDTINSYFRVFGFSEREYISWEELKNILKLKMFLGIKPGVSSRQEFQQYSSQEIDEILVNNGMNVEIVFDRIQADYYKQSNT
jgi:Ca2+-binding EF-hand superfamily protein